MAEVETSQGRERLTGELVQRLMREGAVIIMENIERDMHRMYRQARRRAWVGRACVLANVAVAAYDASLYGQSWVWLCVPGNVWAAWYSLKNAENWASDLPKMRQALADIAEKIELAKGIANES